MIIACDDGLPIGFCHAGFGPNEEQTALDYTNGVIAMIAVRIAQRRQHVGSELLRRSEEYLVRHGAKELFTGGIKPLNPFTYFGLYGGSNSPGFLESDPAMRVFFEGRGYKKAKRCLVMHRKLDQPLNVVDTRFSSLRRRLDIQAMPRGAGSAPGGRSACVEPGSEQFEYRLDEKATGLVVARALYWEMEGFGWRWNTPAAGIMDIQVRSDLRVKGSASNLIAQLLRYLQEQYFGVAEVQVGDDCDAAIKMFRAARLRPGRRRIYRSGSSIAG